MISPSQMTIIFVLENNMCSFAFKLEFIFIYMYQFLILLRVGAPEKKKKTFIVLELSENCRLCHTPDSLHNISCGNSLIHLSRFVF